MRKFLIIILLNVFTFQVYSQSTTELYKALPESYNQNYDDHFGNSVAIDGNYAVIGAYGYEDNTGCAYVLYNNGNTWEIQARLTASDGEPSDYFGNSVNISGNYIVVGAYYDHHNYGSFKGSAYVFTKPAAGWKDTTQTAKLTAFDGAASDNFGTSVSISGDHIAVGAIYDDDNGINSGSVYVFTKPLNGWTDTTQTAKLITSDGTEHDWFGGSICISGNHIVVGATGDDDKGKTSGSAYVFTKPDGDWKDATQTAKLTASDGAEVDRFGTSISISGDYIVIGAIEDDDNGANSGSAYVFTKPLSGWTDTTQNAKLITSDGASGDHFGTSVSISGDHIVVGAIYDDDNETNSGSVYLFTKPLNGWIDTTQTTKLIASDGTSDDFFGISVSMYEDYILVGSPYDDDNGNASGSAYFFYRKNPPVIISQPIDQIDVPSDTTVSFIITAENGNSYQWQLSTDEGVTFLDITDNEIYTNSTTPNLDIIANYDLNNYKYRCAISNGWGKTVSDTVTITIKGATGFNSFEDEGVSIYPNPMKDILKIEFANDKIHKVKIYNLSGKVIMEKLCTSQAETIDVSQLSKGIHIINIQSGEKNISYKILKD